MVRQKALSVGAEQWLDNLPLLVAAMEQDWAIAERVSTGLLGTKVGLQPVAREMLAVADRLAASAA